MGRIFTAVCLTYLLLIACLLVWALDFVVFDHHMRDVREMRTCRLQDKNDLRFEREYDRLSKLMPNWAARTLAWLRQPYARLVRIPIGIIMTIGGIFSILPFLGIWMLPIGLILLAIDVPILRGPVSTGLVRVRHVWERWRRRKKE